MGSTGPHTPCSDVDAVAALVRLQGRQLLDVGCGDGSLARALVQRGATLIGLEPDARQLQSSRAAPTNCDVQFLVAAGDAIPLAKGSVDGVLFVRSLHHIPVPLMDAALREAHRVLQPSGFLMVIEPEIDSPFSQLMIPFHDETSVRRAAKNALARIALELFARTHECYYTTERRFANFGEFATEMVAATFRGVESDQVNTVRVREIFERGRSANGYIFTQRMRVNLFKR